MITIMVEVEIEPGSDICKAPRVSGEPPTTMCPRYNRLSERCEPFEKRIYGDRRLLECIAAEWRAYEQ